MVIGAFAAQYNSNLTNETFLFDSDHNETVYLYPNYESWFILAKANCSFLQAAIAQLPRMLQPDQSINEQLQHQGLLASSLTEDTPLLHLQGSDFNFQMVLRSKQQQLDKQNTSGPQYAVKHFKLWHLELDDSAYKLAIRSRWKRHQMWFDLSHLSHSEYQYRFGQYPYFWRVTWWQWPEFSYLLEHYTEFNCWGGDYLIQP